MDTEKVVSALEKFAEGIAELVAAFEEKDVISAGKLKGKGKKKGKSVEPEDLELDEEDEDDEDEADEEAGEEEDEAEDDSEDEDDEEDDEDEEEDEGLSKLELKNLKDALQKHSAKNSKPKTVKILQKFGKTVNDVTKKDFAKLLKLLKV